MVEQNPVGQPDTQNDGVLIFFVCVSVVIPFGKNRSQLVSQIFVLGISDPAEIYTDAMGGKPVSADGGIGIVFKLCHFSGKGMGDDVEGAVFVVRIYCPYLRYFSCCGGKGDQVVVAEASGHQFSGGLIQFFHKYLTY